jgi:hypothetical protein
MGFLLEVSDEALKPYAKGRRRGNAAPLRTMPHALTAG